MTNSTNKKHGQQLLQRTKLLNGSGKENLKLLSTKELENYNRNLPIVRKKSQRSKIEV